MNKVFSQTMSNTKACFDFMVRTSVIMLFPLYSSLGYSAEKVELDRVESDKKKIEQKAMVVLKPHEIIYGTTSDGEKPVLGTLIGTCGVIKTGSIVFSKDSLLVKFIIGESTSEINVEFIGILPDYFREQGKVIIKGELTSPNTIKTSYEIYTLPEGQKCW